MERGYLGTQKLFGADHPRTPRDWAVHMAINIAWRVTSWDYDRAKELMLRYGPLYWEVDGRARSGDILSSLSSLL